MIKAINQFFVPHNILEDRNFREMKLSSQMLYIHLCRLKNRLNKEGFYRGVRRLAEETGMNKNTIIEAKKQLLKEQYITIERGKSSVSGYRNADIFKINGYKTK